MAKRALSVVGALLLLGACAGERGPVDLPSAEGPPDFRPEVALQHAEQFAGDPLRERPAGSQQEQGAAVYILGVLQRNGYIARLDRVPVRNLVTSTNVIARAPERSSPETVVVAAYDTPSGAAGEDEALGLLLELSRALNVAAPDHGVWFAALGAEHAEDAGSGLGSRSLVELLKAQDADPLIIRLIDVDAAGTLRVGGADSERLRSLAPDGTGRDGAPSTAEDVFADAGLESALVSGGIEQAGTALLRFLRGSED